MSLVKIQLRYVEYIRQKCKNKSATLKVAQKYKLLLNFDNKLKNVATINH